MGPDTTTRERSDTRFFADWSNPVPADLTVGDGQDAEVLSCQLSDLSLSGCAIQMARPPQSDPKHGVIRVKPENSDCELIVAGRLRWQRQTGVGTVTYGFQFRRPLSEACLDSFLRNDLITRRDGKRCVVNLEVQVRQQQPTLSIEQATLVDVSNSGLQLITDIPLTVGARVLVVLSNGRTGIVHVVWATESDSECRAGGGFTTIESGRTFGRLVSELT